MNINYIDYETIDLSDSSGMKFLSDLKNEDPEMKELNTIIEV